MKAKSAPKSSEEVTAPDPSAEAFRRVGRLASFGLEHPFQAALFLPASYLDCRDTEVSALLLDKKQRSPISLTIQSPVSFQGRSGPPRLGFTVVDGNGASFKASIFGDTVVWREKIFQGQTYLFMATGHEFAGSHRVTVHELLPDKYRGRIIPQYPAPRAAIEPEELRALVAKFLPQAIPTAAMHIESQLESIAPLTTLIEELNAVGWTMEQLLQQAHYPQDSIYIEPVRITLQRLAALGSLALARDGVAETTPNPIRMPTLERRKVQMPFVLTEDQVNAIDDIATHLGSPIRPARHMISGGCGVGKTAVSGVVAASLADAGKRTMVLFPSTLVARQAHAEFKRWSPDLAITLVTGDTAGNEDLTAPILMGTSALLHRDAGHVDVLMIDEQHRWSREQREQYRSANTHLIELSATCIPRSQALVRFGHMTVSEMRASHKMKFIHTEMFVGPAETRKLFDEIRPVIKDGCPIFVIYPKRAKSEDENDRLNIEAAAQRWEEMFPGKVATLTGDDDEQSKEDRIQEIRNGTKSILLCTTVVEVGVDVSNLRHIIIVSPQNYGLVQLHQLRGRVARAGGDGWCYLLAPSGLPLQSRDRLQIFLETSDGFKIAEADLAQRGAGDLSVTSQRQHGADGNFLHGMKIDLAVFDQVAPILAQLSPAG